MLRSLWVPWAVSLSHKSPDLYLRLAQYAQYTKMLPGIRIRMASMHGKDLV